MIVERAFKGLLRDANMKFLTANQLTLVINLQRGPDLPDLSHEEIKLVKENLENTAKCLHST